MCLTTRQNAPQGIRTTILDIFEEEDDLIAKLEEVILIGSYARGNFCPDSDVDLVVIVSRLDFAIWAEIGKVNEMLSEKTGKDVHLTPLTREKYETEKRYPLSYAGHVQSEGVVLHETGRRSEFPTPTETIDDLRIQCIDGWLVHARRNIDLGFIDSDNPNETARHFLLAAGWLLKALLGTRDIDTTAKSTRWNIGHLVSLAVDQGFSLDAAPAILVTDATGACVDSIQEAVEIRESVGKLMASVIPLLPEDCQRRWRLFVKV